MRNSIATLAIFTAFVAFNPTAYSQIEWIGDTSSDALDATNWGGGVVPGVGDDVVFRNGGSPNSVADLGGSDIEWGHILLNHAEGGMTVNGAGTITVNAPGGGANIDVKGIESQGGERLSVFHPNVVTNAVIEARNGHDMVFEGSVEAYTVHSFNGSEIVFNGDFKQLAYENGQLFTGNHEGSTIVFNGGLDLDRPAFFGDLGIRNGVTVAFGPDSTLSKTTPVETTPGLGSVNLFNQATIRLDGDYALDGESDFFSRGGGGVRENTLDLNGYSATLEFLGTAVEEGIQTKFIVDYGEQNGANTFLWAASHQAPGVYEIVNYEIGVDTLQLGVIESVFWSDDDMTTTGGGSPDIEIKKSNITINGIPYAAYDPEKTDAYWTLVDPTVSRAVEVFNAETLPLLGDYNDDGIVDAADYTTWRDNLDSDATALNGNGSGGETVVQADYDLWAANYGNVAITPPPAAGASVPEPVAAVLALMGVALGGATRRGRHSLAPSTDS